MEQKLTNMVQVRRGADRAEIYSLAFSPTAQWLAVSSDKDTVHVFSLKVNLGNVGSDRSDSPPDSNTAVNTYMSSLSFNKGVLPKYFSSKWSVAQFRLPEGSQHIAAFGHQKNTIVILGLDGRDCSDKRWQCYSSLIGRCTPIDKGIMLKRRFQVY